MCDILDCDNIVKVMLLWNVLRSWMGEEKSVDSIFRIEE